MINPDKIFGRLGNRMFQSAYIYAQSKKGEIPDIFIQSEEFFKGSEEDIKILFGSDIGMLPNYVGIHVRRGDYVDNPFYVDLTKTNYYEKAMAMFPNGNFLVFSDDPEFCKEYFKDVKNIQVMEDGSEIDDMNMLASCENIIMANSSFSWWAAYIGHAVTVISPGYDKWYTDGSQIRTKLLDKWIKL